MKRASIKYYQQAGNICYLKGITDLRPQVTVIDIKRLNDCQTYLGRTHWQVVLANGNESKVMELKGE